MDELTQRVMDMIRLNPNTPENLPNNFGFNNVKKIEERPVQFDLDEYLKLKGNIGDGRYNLEFKRPENNMIPLTARYSTPLMGGLLDMKYELNPENRGLLINYNKKF